MSIGDLPWLLLGQAMVLVVPAMLVAVLILSIRFGPLSGHERRAGKANASFARRAVPGSKGQAGEAQVNSLLRRELDAVAYRLLPDVMLPAPGGTTQIDHVIVSRYGIFVIETKTFKGWIFGHERDKQWTQVLFKRKHRFQNPLRQNYRHTKTLSDVTGIPHDYFISVVVFAGDARIKTQMPANVVSLQRLVPFIVSHQAPVFQDDQIAHLAGLIQGWAGTVTEERAAKHVVNLHLNRAPISTQSEAPVCLRCGERMVLRTNGQDSTQFWGCSIYPRCRGTRKAAPHPPPVPIGASSTA